LERTPETWLKNLQEKRNKLAVCFALLTAILFRIGSTLSTLVRGLVFEKKGELRETSSLALGFESRLLHPCSFPLHFQQNCCLESASRGIGECFCCESYDRPVNSNLNFGIICSLMTAMKRIMVNLRIEFSLKRKQVLQSRVMSNL